MDYLKHVLGIQVTYGDDALKSMPNYIYARYRLRQVMLDRKAVVFVYPKTELESISSIKKHLERIEAVQEVPAVLVPEHLTYRQKEYLLRDHIPFVVDGKQIYLPFMAMYLQERGDGEKQERTTMLPSAQLLLLHFIYRGCEELITSEAAVQLGFTSTSISRASRQLEEMGLIQTEKRGVQKVLISGKTPKELFDSAKDAMLNPVKRTVYVPKEEVSAPLLLSGYSALSEYSMMNPPAVTCMAAESISAWDKVSSGRLQNADDQYAVELWRYDPTKLSDGVCVDRLSLALALSEDMDERVEEAVEGLLDDEWRELNGKRN